MQCEKTKLGIRRDFPVSISSTIHGANINAVGFNVDHIAERDPTLLKDLLRLYKKAKKLIDSPPIHTFEERFDPSKPLEKAEV